jgi:hypothetical protein
LRKKREEWSEQQKNAKKIEEEPVEEDQDNLPRIEPVTYQVTETKTRTDQPDLRAEQDKSRPRARVEPTKLERRSTPPGPGQYVLPSDVTFLLECSLMIRLKELHLDSIKP